VYAHIKLSKKPLTHKDNFLPFVFFMPLILIGYCSVISTVYLIVTG